MLIANQKQNNKPYATMWNDLKLHGIITTEVEEKDVDKIRKGIAKNKYRDEYFLRLHPTSKINFETSKLDSGKFELKILLLHANINAELF